MNFEKVLDSELTKSDLLALIKKQEDTIYALQHSDRKYENLFENSIDGLYKSTVDGKLIDANTAMIKMLGYDSKEELLAIGNKAELCLKVVRVSKDDESFGGDNKDLHQICKKNGSKIWVKDYGGIIKDEKGNVLYYEGIIRDVTEFKRTIDLQKVLLKISQVGHNINNFKDYNRFIIKQIGKLMDVSNSYIAFYNNEKQTINIPFIKGEESEEEFPVGKSMTGYLIKGNKTLMVKAKAYRELIQSGTVNLIGTFPEVWLGVPLRIDGVAIGAIVVQSYDNPNAYDQKDVELLEFVSTYISSAIQGSRQRLELKKFSLAVEQSVNTIVITDENGDIEYVNSKFIETTGYTKDAALGINPRILNSGRQPKEYYSNMWQTISSGKEWVGEFQNKAKNGKIYWERVAISPIKNEYGVITNYMAIKEDITKEKVTQEKLVKASTEVIVAKEVLRKVLDNIPIKIFWKDLDSKFLGVNVASIKEKKFKDENDVIGKSDFDFYDEKWAQKYRNDEVEIMKSGVPKLNYIETQVVNGEERSYISNKLPFYDENNNVIGIIGTSEDISEKLNYENKLKQVTNEATLAKEVLRKVLDNIPIKVFWKNKKLNFLGCNDAFLKDNLFKNEEEIIGKSDFDFNNKNDAETYRKDDVAVMLSGKPKLNFQHSDTRNGKKRWITTSKLPFFDENNNVIGIIGTSEDITERRENEIKLKKATESAVAANLSKSIFLSNMSHEIRTPMNAILGYSQLLQDDDNLTKKQLDNLSIINKSGAHLLDLINDILDMSKIEAGRITLKPVDFNLKDLLNEVMQLFSFKAAQNKIDFSLTIENDLPKNILADESKIKQVIINIVGNALKFTKQGFVRLYVKKLDANCIQISVKDSGKGIVLEEHETIFKPFEQAKIGGKTEGGTGLGLAISKKFSNLMGGDITIESEYNVGSNFVFTFSFKNSEDEILNENIQNFKVKSLAPEMLGLKVAIVDDRFENRDILYQKLQPLGFELKMAENGLEAIELYKSWKPDLILMDVVMPILSGVEATRKIFEIAEDHPVKIFIVSASALESEQKEVMEIGATVFIKKPVIFSELLWEMSDKANIKFLYENEKENEIVEGVITEISSSIKQQFIEAASKGDFLLLQELLVELENNTSKSFKYLENCIEELEFEELINWLKS